MSMKGTLVLGVALSLVSFVAYPVLAEGPAVPVAPAVAPAVAPVKPAVPAPAVAPAAPDGAVNPEKAKEHMGMPPKQPGRPPVPGVPIQDLTLTGKIVVKSVVLVDGEGREIFLPYTANENSATGTNAPIDPKSFVGKTVTVVCKGREAGLNPRTGKKNVMISSIESIKEGAATVPAKP